MKHKHIFVGCTAMALCLAGGSHAQTATEQSASDSLALTEIVVTAQRQSESLQQVPIAVSAVTAEALAARGIADSLSLEVAVPNLTLTQNGVSITPFLRGVGSNQSNPNDEASVATYIDGIYIPSVTGNIFRYNNIERIEVLKGPQGTLFGRNATGGVIQIVTRDPETEPLFQGDIGYGKYDTIEASAYATTGLGANLAADLSVVYARNGDGYGRDINRDADIFKRNELGLRSKILWTAGERTEIRLSADYSRLKSTGTDYQLAEGVIGVDGVTSWPGKRKTNTDWKNTGDNEVYGGSLRIDHDFDFARFVSLTGYRHVDGDFHLDQDATPTPIVRADINQFAESWSQEFQLLAPSGSAIDWLLGAYYFNADYAYTPLRIEGFGAAPFTTLDLYGSQNTESLSAYGQATIPLTESTGLTFGLRYTTEDQKTKGSIVGDGVVVLPEDLTRQKQNFKKLTWRVALDHDFSDDILGYLSYNRGIKSGGFNMINANTPGYNPEILDAFEAGLKTQLFDRRVRFNIAAFFYKYKDIQVFNITGGGAVLTTNAAKAEVKGIDIDAAWRVTNELTLSGGLGVLDSEYTDFPDATYTPPSPLDGPQTTIDATGNDLIYAPKVSGNVALDYAMPTDVGTFNLNGTLSFRDKVYVSAANRLAIPGYTVVNASLGWTSTSEKFGVKLWARNLFDKDYYLNRTEQALGDIQFLAPPRTFGVTFSVKTR